MFRVGIDVGGTFTDLVLWNEVSGEIHVAKVLTTHDDQARGMLAALRQVLSRLGPDGLELSNVVQATTLVSNALVERKGAPTGLITTAGFRDVLETRTEKRYDLYDFNARLPDPLVPRWLRLGVLERVNARGEIVTPLDVQAAEAAVRQLLAAGVEALAVCFLHSYLNPAHERMMGDIIARLAPTLDVSLSCDVAPQIREYPRLSTTVANAYVRPLTARHIASTERALGEVGFHRTSYLMTSGAVVTAEVARRTPIRLVDSGAAAGVVAAAYYGAAADAERLISFEMGGTTAKICFIEGDQPAFTDDFEVDRVDRSRKGSGLAIALPAIDLVEIGAGGGSIAWVDDLGLLKVGPRSAGSQPGPACYGLGGSAPTVTDANLALGYLDPDYFLGGQMPLRRDLAEDALERVARPLAIETVDAAWGIHRIVTEGMVNAAREYSAEQGRDPRSYALIAFGGAGPAHAVRFARALGCAEVIIPPGAGVASAIGTLASPFGFDAVRTYLVRFSALDLAALNRLLAEMEAEARGLVAGSGVPAESITVRRFADMRYVGQTHDIRVPIPGGVLEPSDLQAIADGYARQYEHLFHHPNLPYELECTNWRVFASGPRPALSLTTFGQMKSGSAGRSAEKGRRLAHFPELGGFQPCSVYERQLLLPGTVLEGPAIAEDPESTIVLPPGATARCEADHQLRIKV
jgi:N-methylhydantoinase A/oxoprolinase/acetone carboxylase beta subunit